MLKTLIKRDGRIEPVNPSKVNGWGQWAANELQGRVDWSYIVLTAIETLPEQATTAELQQRLIKICREQRSWAYSLMAGKLYATTINKEIHPGGHPSLKVLHEKLLSLGHMRLLDYSDDEYDQAEAMLAHERDFKCTYFELHQVRDKYAIKNEVTGEEYETMQFTYMRMAMALAEDQPKERRMKDVFHFYDLFSRKIINAPTPNYLNLGTDLRGYASCCLYAVDDNCRSLAAGDHIAYTMTYMSAGIGNTISIRSAGEPVRGGKVPHQGKLPYYKALAGAVKANLQNGRGGACTTYFSGYDPDATEVLMMRNPRTTEDKKMRDLDFALMTNKFMAKMVAKNEPMFTFNTFTAPDLHEALFGDGVEFERLYRQYEADPNFKKNYVSARELILKARTQMFETGRGYMAWMDEANRHTPFKEPIRSSNLCTEIFEHTSPYQHIADLYSAKDPGRITIESMNGRYVTMPWSDPVTVLNHTTWAGNLQVGQTFIWKGEQHTVAKVTQRLPSPEVALCSLAGIVLSNVKDDEEYELAAYYSLLMIKKCIEQADYELPHVGYTAKNRMNAGVGVTGLATHLARKNLKYSSLEGKHESHRLAERHMYYLIKGALKIGKESGNAPWMYKTKWPEGWLPIDTYNKNVDSIGNFPLEREWEPLRQEIVDNGGIAFSILASFMPTESSSKASGQPNSLYPVRFTSMLKTDEHTIIDWCAPDNDLIGNQYELAWNCPTNDLIDHYALWQKFSDGGISADTYRRIGEGEMIGSKEMIGVYLYMTKMGLKSCYYTNSLTSVAKKPEAPEGVTIQAKPVVEPVVMHAVPSLLQAAEGLPKSEALSELIASQASSDVGQLIHDAKGALSDQSTAADKPMSALDRIAAQARAMINNPDEEGTFVGNDGPVCTSGGCSI